MSAMTDHIIMWVMSIVFGLGFLGSLIYQTFTLGFKAVWGTTPWPRPTSLDDPALGTHGYVKTSEVKLHYVAAGPEDKPLMLFLHGFPEFWFSWRNQLKEFQKDFRVVAVDQRGYGESDKPRGVENYTTAKLLNDVRGVISGLGYKSCIVVCHDWGGAIGWAFARQFPDMVDKLIVMNAPAALVFRKIIKTSKAQQKMSWYMSFFQLPYLPELALRIRNYHAFDGFYKTAKNAEKVLNEEMAAYKYTFSQSGALTPPINWYRAAFGSMKNQVNYDMNYAMPVLLIWGTADMHLHMDLVDETQKQFPKVDVRKIPDVGHFVQTEAPEEVNKHMREWLG